MSGMKMLSSAISSAACILALVLTLANAPRIWSIGCLIIAVIFLVVRRIMQAKEPHLTAADVTLTPEQYEDVRRLMEEGKPVEAIRLVRQHNRGVGLVAVREYVTQEFPRAS